MGAGDSIPVINVRTILYTKRELMHWDLKLRQEKKWEKGSPQLLFFFKLLKKEFYTLHILQMYCVCFHIFNLQMFTSVRCPPTNHLFFSNFVSWQTKFRYSIFFFFFKTFYNISFFFIAILINCVFPSSPEWT